MRIHLLSILGNWGEGHKAAPRKVWSALLENLIKHGALTDTFFEIDNIASLVTLEKKFSL